MSWGALLVARLLTPEDYGLVGMALIAVAVAQLVGEAGLVAALVADDLVPVLLGPGWGGRGAVAASA